MGSGYKRSIQVRASKMRPLSLFINRIAILWQLPLLGYHLMAALSYIEFLPCNSFD